MNAGGQKTLSEISPEEFDRIERLARRRTPGASANSLVLSVGLGTVLSLVLWFLIFPFDLSPITLPKFALVTATIAFSALVFWGLIYVIFERPREKARKHLDALKRELLSREQEPGQSA